MSLTGRVFSKYLESVDLVTQFIFRSFDLNVFLYIYSSVADWPVTT